MAEPDLIVVGAGPAGLAAAIEARRLGLTVTVLDREGEAGGIPRHCGHRTYRTRPVALPITGPAYARHLVAAAQEVGAEIRTGTAVVAVHEGPRLTVGDGDGVRQLAARRVLLATGVRETTRAARLIGGTKPGGVMNTATLQGLVYLKAKRPFSRPLIVGSELVAFSAILTCRHAGIRPVAMVEPDPAVTARWPVPLIAYATGVPIRRGTALAAIEGGDQVEAAVLERDGTRQRLACDGVILTGGFRPESTLVRDSHLALDPATGGPAIDQFGRTSDPAIFAAGNLLRGVETALWCADEGRAAARAIALSLTGALPPAEPALRLEPGEAVAYVVPQRIAGSAREGRLQLRAARPVAGRLRLGTAGARRLSTRPQRRVTLPLAALPPDAEPGRQATEPVRIGMESE